MNIWNLFKPFWETAKSVLPIVMLLCIFQIIILKKPIKEMSSFVCGVVLTMIGLHLFLKGVSTSLIPLGDSIGGNLIVLNNKYLVLLFAFAIGYFGTMVEPGLQSLAIEVEDISSGSIPANVLINAVGIGFGLGMALGIIKILNNIPTKQILFPIMIAAIILGYFAPSEFVDIAIDSASATTGPVNIPLNMAISLGLSKVLENSDPLLNGFGIIGLTSIGSVISVLVLGILSKI